MQGVKFDAPALAIHPRHPDQRISETAKVDHLSVLSKRPPSNPKILDYPQQNIIKSWRIQCSWAIFLVVVKEPGDIWCSSTVACVLCKYLQPHLLLSRCRCTFVWEYHATNSHHILGRRVVHTPDCSSSRIRVDVVLIDRAH